MYVGLLCLTNFKATRCIKQHAFFIMMLQQNKGYQNINITSINSYSLAVAGKYGERSKTVYQYIRNHNNNKLLDCHTCILLLPDVAGQLYSSFPLAQSFSPSHLQPEQIQWEFPQWNWFTSQGATTARRTGYNHYIILNNIYSVNLVQNIIYITHTDILTETYQTDLIDDTGVIFKVIPPSHIDTLHILNAYPLVLNII